MAHTTIYLIRHGETDWNREQRYQGQQDIPLNSTGIEQAQLIADNLNGHLFSALYSSDLMRAYQTAQEIAKKVKLSITTHPALREINQGEWEGRYIKDVLASSGDEVRAVYQNPYTARKPGGKALGKWQSACTHIWIIWLKNMINKQSLWFLMDWQFLQFCVK